MDSRERVLTALRHEEADRVPFDLSSTPVTGIHRVAYRNLRQGLGLEVREVQTWHMMQQLAVMEEEVHEAMETDVRGLRPNAQSTWKLELREEGEYRHYTDEWGIERRTQ
ncbi:MAG: hypothetical protein HOC74_15730, partial [Gemmatimonadetes bacterium]|nr:hypothetical protein [Gemmatimonadota bacterium]